MKKFINGFTIIVAILLATPAFSMDLENTDKVRSRSHFKKPSVSRPRLAMLLLEWDLVKALGELGHYKKNFDTYYFAVNSRLSGRPLQPHEHLSDMLSKTEAKFLLGIPLTPSERQELDITLEEEKRTSSKSGKFF